MQKVEIVKTTMRKKEALTLFKPLNKAKWLNKDISLFCTSIKRSRKQNRELTTNPLFIYDKVTLQSKEERIVISLIGAGITEYLHGKSELIKDDKVKDNKASLKLKKIM